MGSLYKLITKTNIKSPALAFPLVFPLIMLLMYSVMIQPDLLLQSQVNSAILVMFITAVSLTTMQSGLMGFGFNFIKLKKSVMLRRIGATKLTKAQVLGAVVLYGVTIWFVSIIWLTIWAYIFSAAGLFYSVSTTGLDSVVGHLDLGQLNWPMFLAATIATLLISYSIGLFFASFAKDDMIFHAIVMLYFFGVGLIGGLMIPGIKPDWMINAAYIFPNTYANELFGLASGIIEIGSGTDINVQYISEGKAIADFVVPVTLSVVLFIGSIKILKFD